MSDQLNAPSGTGYPPGTPMLREELSQGSLRPKRKDRKAQTKLEKHRRELIDLLGRISDYGNPLESEERIRLIDLNVGLAKKRSDAAKAATEAARAKLEAVKAGLATRPKPNNTLSPPSKTYTIHGPESNKKDKQKDKQKEVAKDDCDEESCSCSEESDCSMADDDFEATLSPYIKETLKSSLHTKVQIINAECIADGLPPPARDSAISRAVAQLRDKIADGAEGDDDKLVSDIALKILDEFSIRQRGASVQSSD